MKHIPLLPWSSFSLGHYRLLEPGCSVHRCSSVRDTAGPLSMMEMLVGFGPPSRLVKFYNLTFRHNTVTLVHLLYIMILVTL